MQAYQEGGTKFYFPGKTPGQPYKHDYTRMCYNITKTLDPRTSKANGDRLDYFLSNADQKINYYDDPMNWHGNNPFNPYNMEAQFSINVIDDGQMKKMGTRLEQDHGIKGVTDLLVVEGCMDDDKTVLGGKNEFLNHFCTFFKFNICYSAAESAPIRKQQKRMSDPDVVDASFNGLLERLDRSEL